MKLSSIFAIVVSMSFSRAELDNNSGGIDAIDNDIDCSLHIGDRDELDDRHRRMVAVNLLPGRCEDRDIINVHIPHDGIKRSFNRVNLSNDGIEGNKIRKTEAIATSSGHEFTYWYGEDANDGSTFNYVQDENGNIQGSLIDINSHSVMQISVENGNHITIITDSSGFKPEIPAPLLDDDVDIREKRLSTETTESNAAITTTVSRSTPRSYLRKNNSPPADEKQNQDYRVRALNNDSGDVLDVMVVWTKKAECKNYGLSEGCILSDETSAAMEARINLAVDETNTAFELSGAETRLFLAHSYRHETFVETSMTSSLSALQAGDISGTEQNRETYGADLVVMMLDDDFYCGSGYLGPRINEMYSVTAWNCATGNFSFGHEIGHNLGLRHDRATEFDCDSNKYMYGYRDPQARFRTILAYDCEANQCDNNPGGGCTRIQRFSNPDPKYDWNGLPIGTPKSNNVRRINKVKSLVAGYLPHGGTGGSSSTTSDTAQDQGGSKTPETPSKTPTSSPSLKPTESSCKDSPLEFFFQKQFINCAFAHSQNLCSDSDIQALCPSSCGTCSNCADPNVRIKFFNTVKGIPQTKGCDIIATNTKTKCDFYGVSDSCRATCGTC